MIPTLITFRLPCRAGIFALCCALWAPASLAAAPDIRILIDVSGSMKQNDPANLRVPALRLLTELLPAGATAGVWLFDQVAQPVLAPQTVDASWKTRARAVANRIHSHGLFTHIEAGLDAATADWTMPAASDAPRHVILLTDGMVDIGKDAAASAASRTRLLADALTRFQVLGAHVNTVALSAQADSALLSAIAKGTDGWFQQVADATALQRVFLHLFEQAAAPDGLPLDGNRFTVDTSVRELTVLVFHAPGAPALELTAPDGRVIRRADADDSIAWQREAGYDLVTLTSPRAGEWSFNAPQDPDNRALVVTDLGLEVDELPTNVLPGEPLPVAARLLEQGAPLTRREFLELVKVDAATSGPGGAGEVTPLVLDAAASTFGGAASAAVPGDYELIVRVDGGTFQRERHRRFHVNGEPFTFDVGSTKDPGGARVIHLTVTADPELIAPETLSGLLELHMPDAAPQVIEMPALDGNEITLELPAAAAGDYVMQPWLFAETHAARAVRLKPDPLTISFGDGTPGAETAPTPAPPLPPPATFSWAMAAGVVAAGNVGLGSVLGGLWFALRRRGIPTKGTSV